MRTRTAAKAVPLFAALILALPAQAAVKHRVKAKVPNLSSAVAPGPKVEPVLCYYYGPGSTSGIWELDQAYSIGGTIYIPSDLAGRLGATVKRHNAVPGVTYEYLTILSSTQYIDQSESMAGIKQLILSVDVHDPSGSYTKEAVQSQIEARLRSAGIKIAPEKYKSPSEMWQTGSFLFILDVNKIGYS